MLPQDFIYQLKQANPIDQVMESYVHLVRAGSLLKCQCPFHSEKTPSCFVYANSQDPHFYCFGCHAGGDVISFIRQIEGLGYMDAVRMLADRAGMTVPADGKDSSSGETRLRMRLLELNRDAAKFYYTQLTGSDKRGLVYLMERGLKPETINKYGLGYAGDDGFALLNAMRSKGYTDEELYAANLCGRSQRSGKPYDRFRNRVIFPIMDLRGSVIAFGGRTIIPGGEPKYLNSSDTPVFKKGRNLFSLHFAKKSQSKRLILAEGYMDVIAMNQAGFENTVASLGTALTPDQCRLMRQYAEEVVISYDSDAAGQNATVKAINLLRAVGIRPRILHVEGAKDPDEYLKKYGPSGFRMLLEDAKDAMSFELDRCKAGTDTGTEDGAVTALHKAVSVLAQIENPLDRSVYISQIANEYNIKKTVLQEQVDEELRAAAAGKKKAEKRNVLLAAQMRDPLNPDADKNRREANAEEIILWRLMRHPDELEDILGRIQPEEFVTDLHRRIFSFLAEMLKQGIVSPDYGEQFSPEENGRIYGIQAKYDEMQCGIQAVEGAIGQLKEYHSMIRPEQADQLSDEEFNDLFRQLGTKKQKKHVSAT